MAAASAGRRLKNPVLLYVAGFRKQTAQTSGQEVPSVCDIQERLTPVIYENGAVLATIQKLLKATQILNIPIIATTQLRAKLGPTCQELGLDSTYPTVAHLDKSAFSMWTPEVKKALSKQPQTLDPNSDSSTKRWDILLVGIETHICVLQTALDAIKDGHHVYVIADGVSSCNAEERAIALARLRQEGAKVTTSESILFECVGDALDPAFRAVSGLVKETKESTKTGLGALCRF